MDPRTVFCPHDPEARYSRKRQVEWVGDKVQVTETEDEGYPHIITDIVATSSNQTDYEELPAIQERLAQRDCQPAEHYVDAGYMSGPNLHHSPKRQIDLIGRLPTVTTPQDLLLDGITRAQFSIDAETQTVTCPQGVSATHPSPVNHSLCFRLPAATCAACELRARCCTGKGGRTVGISAYYALTEAAYARQKNRSLPKGLPPTSQWGRRILIGVGTRAGAARGTLYRVKETPFAGRVFRLCR